MVDPGRAVSRVSEIVAVSDRIAQFVKDIAMHQFRKYPSSTALMDLLTN